MHAIVEITDSQYEIKFCTTPVKMIFLEIPLIPFNSIDWHVAQIFCSILYITPTKIVIRHYEINMKLFQCQLIF